MTNQPPSEEALALLAAWPTGAWITERGLASAVGGSLNLGDRRLRSVLNECRRRSWLIRDQRYTPPVWKRTPTVTQAAAQ